MNTKETAKRLERALEYARLTAAELSERSGVSQSSISQYVNGVHSPSNISSTKMGNVLGVNPMWLMGFDVDMLLEWRPKFQEIEVTDDLSEEEYKIICAYRDSDEQTKEMVRRILAYIVKE